MHERRPKTKHLQGRAYFPADAYRPLAELHNLTSNAVEISILRLHDLNMLVDIWNGRCFADDLS